MILGHHPRPDREALFRAHGRDVESLCGRYITAEDVGTSADDMEFVRRETRYVTGLHGLSGDPSPMTALGTLEAIRAAATEVYGDGSLDGVRIAVQGVGNVGFHLCDLLSREGARLMVTDIDSAKVERAVEAFEAEAVGQDEIYLVEAQVFPPCALGGVIRSDTPPLLRVDIVAGAANNQLADPSYAEALQALGILCAPDYVGNAGGLISIYGELHGWESSQASERIRGIFGTMKGVFELARREGVNPSTAADQLAEARLREARNARGIRS